MAKTFETTAKQLTTLGKQAKAAAKLVKAQEKIAAEATKAAEQATEIESEILAAEALGLMNERAITSLFVVANGLPVGIVHIHDCLRAGLI